MVAFLESPFLQLVIDLQTSTWRVLGKAEASPYIEGASPGVRYRHGRRRRFLNCIDRVKTMQDEVANSPHGPVHQVRMDCGTAPDGLDCKLTFALTEKHPLLMWRIDLENCGDDPFFLDRLDMLQVGGRSGRLDFASSQLASHVRSPTPAFFSNGWQSWSRTGVYGAMQKSHRTRLGPLQRPVNTNPSTPHTWRAGHFSSDMFAVIGDRTTRGAILVGFLSERQHFGSLQAWIGSMTPALSLWANGDGARLDPGASFSTDWACILFLDVDDRDPMGPYLDAVLREHMSVGSIPQQDDTPALRYPLRSIPVGWCSWYHYFQQVTAGDILSNLGSAERLRSDLHLDVIQIDDGFESQVADWFSFRPTFPGGVGPLAAEVSAADMIPGLWLAPFIVHPKSELLANHPDWLLRGFLNRPVNAGYQWGTIATALDMTHPDTLAYAAEVVNIATHHWGFPYIKLDFLYAAALPGRHHDATQTRAQILRASLEALRAAAGDETFLLGCGCPLGPAIGVVDAMRVSADVDLRWKPNFKGIHFMFQDEPHAPSVRNALHNDLTRSFLHNRWWINDPDCLLLNPESELSLDEVQTLASVIGLTGGSLFLSGDLTGLPLERLRIAEKLLPLIGLTPRVMDWFDHIAPRHLRLDLEGETGNWHLLALINWEDNPREMVLRLADYRLEVEKVYWAREFWSGRFFEIRDGFIPLGNLPAHATALLAVRPITPNAPLYAGSDLHISQGLEVTVWKPAPEGLSFEIQRPGLVMGQVDLVLPHAPRQVWVNAEPARWKIRDGWLCRLDLDTREIAVVKVSWRG